MEKVEGQDLFEQMSVARIPMVDSRALVKQVIEGLNVSDAYEANSNRARFDSSIFKGLRPTADPPKHETWSIWDI